MADDKLVGYVADKIGADLTSTGTDEASLAHPFFAPAQAEAAQKKINGLVSPDKGNWWAHNAAKVSDWSNNAYQSRVVLYHVNDNGWKTLLPKYYDEVKSDLPAIIAEDEKIRKTAHDSAEAIVSDLKGQGFNAKLADTPSAAVKKIAISFENEADARQLIYNLESGKSGVHPKGAKYEIGKVVPVSSSDLPVANTAIPVAKYNVELDVRDLYLASDNSRRKGDMGWAKTIISDHARDVNKRSSNMSAPMHELAERLNISSDNFVRKGERWVVKGLDAQSGAELASTLNTIMKDERFRQYYKDREGYQQPIDTQGKTFAKYSDGELTIDERFLHRKPVNKFNTGDDIAIRAFVASRKSNEQQIAQHADAEDKANLDMLNGSFVSQERGITWKVAKTEVGLNRGVSAFRSYIATGPGFDGLDERAADLKAEKLNQAYGLDGKNKGLGSQLRGFGVMKRDGKFSVFVPEEFLGSAGRDTLISADEKVKASRKGMNADDIKNIAVLNDAVLLDAQGVGEWEAAKDSDGLHYYKSKRTFDNKKDAQDKAKELNAAYALTLDKGSDGTPLNPFASTSVEQKDGKYVIFTDYSRMTNHKYGAQMLAAEKERIEAIAEIEKLAREAEKSAQAANSNADKLKKALEPAITKSKENDAAGKTTVARLREEKLKPLLDQENAINAELDQKKATLQPVKDEKESAEMTVASITRQLKAGDVQRNVLTQFEATKRQAEADVQRLTGQIQAEEAEYKRFAESKAPQLADIGKQKEAVQKEIDALMGVGTVANDALQGLNDKVNKASGAAATAIAANEAIKELADKSKGTKSIVDARAMLKTAKEKAGTAKKANDEVIKLAQGTVKDEEIQKPAEEKPAGKAEGKGGDEPAAGEEGPETDTSGAPRKDIMQGGYSGPKKEEGESSWWGIGAGLVGALVMAMMGMDILPIILIGLLLAGGTDFLMNKNGPVRQMLGMGESPEKDKANEIAIYREKTDGTALSMKDKNGKEREPAILVNDKGQIVADPTKAAYVAYGTMGAADKDGKRQYEINRYSRAADVNKAQDGDVVAVYELPTPIKVDTVKHSKGTENIYTVPAATDLSALTNAIKAGEQKKDGAAKPKSLAELVDVLKQDGKGSKDEWAKFDTAGGKADGKITADEIPEAQRAEFKRMLEENAGKVAGVTKDGLELGNLVADGIPMAAATSNQGKTTRAPK